MQASLQMYKLDIASAFLTTGAGHLDLVQDSVRPPYSFGNQRRFGVPPSTASRSCSLKGSTSVKIFRCSA